MIVLGGSSDTNQEQMGAFQEMPQVQISFYERSIKISFTLLLLLFAAYSITFHLSIGRFCSPSQILLKILQFTILI